MTLAIPSKEEFNRTFHTDKVATFSPRTQELFSRLQTPQDTSWYGEVYRMQQIVVKRGLSARDVVSPLFRIMLTTALIASAILLMIYIPPTAGSVFLFAGPGYQVFVNAALFTPALASAKLILCAVLGGPIVPLKELKNKIHKTRPQVFHADQQVLLQKIKESSNTFNRDYPSLKKKLVELKEVEALAELEKLKNYYDLYRN